MDTDFRKGIPDPCDTGKKMSEIHLFTQQEMFMYARIRLQDRPYLSRYSPVQTVNMTVPVRLRQQVPIRS